MSLEKTLEILTDRACPAIQYRLRRELGGDSPTSAQMQELQAQILEDGLVRAVLGWQNEDSWLAWNFHGQESLESGVRILCEKGLEPDHPVIATALHALANHPERIVRGLGKVGPFLDQHNLGGSEMIRACVFAYAKTEDRPDIREQILLALAAFQAVLAIRSSNDLVLIRREKTVLRQGIVWPSLYHLRLLAWTRSWRAPENLQMLSQSIDRLVALSPIPHFSVLKGSQLVAPASFCMDDFAPDLSDLRAKQWMMWFQRMELLARLGVVPLVPELQKQVSALQTILDEASGFFTKKLNHSYFRLWGAYTGLMLEKDWKDPLRRENDLTFRGLLILHYAQRR